MPKLQNYKMFIDKTVDAFLLSNKTLIKNLLVFLIVLKFVPTNLFGLKEKLNLPTLYCLLAPTLKDLISVSGRLWVVMPIMARHS